MKPVVKQSNKKAAFTIIELLTVMSVIIILIGLLVPAMNMVRRFARKVTQKNQFHSIEVAMETFNAEWDGYPSSEGYDYVANAPLNYCGVQRLAEAMVGQDLLGFHPDSKFIPGDDAYNLTLNPDLSGRRLYLKLGSANAYRLGGFYSGNRLLPFAEDHLVLCDVYRRNVTYNDPTVPQDPMNGQLVGMPILYYRANTSGITHPIFDKTTNQLLNGVSVDDPGNIYNYRDNHTFVALGKPWDATWPQGDSWKNDLLEPRVFYQNTWNDKIDIEAGRPHNTDTFILISAGFDGVYGTDDDVSNFGL
ncbi:MAG: type II secretion system protein [Planctomycetota bacterium]